MDSESKEELEVHWIRSDWMHRAKETFIGGEAKVAVISPICSSTRSKGERSSEEEARFCTERERKEGKIPSSAWSKRS